MKTSSRLSKSYIKNWYQSLFSWLVLFINVMATVNCAVVDIVKTARKSWKSGNNQIMKFMVF